MKTLTMVTALVFLFSALVWTPAFAYSGAEVSGKAQRASMEKGYSMENGFRAHQFLGETVKNEKGQTLGKVSDLVFNKKGKLEYVILEHRKFLTVKFIPIPYEFVKATPARKALIVNISEESLTKAPMFARNDWKEFDNPEWNKKVHSYYEWAGGMQPKTQERPMKMEHHMMKSPQTEQRSGYGY